MSKKKKSTKKSTKETPSVQIDFEKCVEDPKVELKEPETWTIITALNWILEWAEDSQLLDYFWKIVRNPLAFLRKELGLTDIQIVVLAAMVEKGEAVSWRTLGQFFDCSRLTIMTYSEEIEELVKKRWIVRKACREIGGYFQGFMLAHGVVTALRHNQTFVPEKIDGLTEQEFVDRLETYVRKTRHNNSVDFSDTEERMLQLINANHHLPLCKTLLTFDDIHIQSLLLLTVVDYGEWEGDENEGLNFCTIDGTYPDDFQCNNLRYHLRQGTHPLIQQGLIEQKCVDGHADSNIFVLTSKTKEELLANYSPSHSECQNLKQERNRFLKSHNTIKEKSLFYNVSDQEQIVRLTNLLSPDNLTSVQQRLEEQGMRKGFACLFYGGPGTGKTETVLQLARQTGRDIMQVDIAGMRDKYVGESEKNIKNIFTRYRKLCQSSDITPILFFNEADGIFGKRTTFSDKNSSVEKMDNAMQNIILQEIEDLDGILIATTNLTSNLDKAFERRFLFKIEFHQPDTAARAKIWKTMLKDISDEDALQLASHYDFSGGQIENVARKHTIDYILTGAPVSLADIERYCHAEEFNHKSRPRIGFC